MITWKFNISHKALSVLLCVALLLSCVPLTVSAADSEGCGHDHSSDTPFTAETTLGNGGYYLTEDVTLSTAITTAGISWAEICLNGHTLTGPAGAPAITVTDGGLYIYGPGCITGDESGAVISVTGGSVGIVEGITVAGGENGTAVSATGGSVSMFEGITVAGGKNGTAVSITGGWCYMEDTTVAGGDNGTAIAVSDGKLALKAGIAVSGPRTLEVTGGTVAVDAGVQFDGIKSVTGGTIQTGDPLPEGAVIPEGVTVCVYSFSAAVPFGSRVKLQRHVTVTKYTSAGSSSAAYSGGSFGYGTVLDAEGNLAEGVYLDLYGSILVEPNRVTEAMCKNGEPLTALIDGASDVCNMLIRGQVTILPQVVLDEQGLSLLPGDTAVLTATAYPADIGTVTWTSSNPAVATVANGTVTAVSVGSATITATPESGAAATCLVLVSDGTLSLGGTTLKSGKYYAVSPENTLAEADAAPESGGYAYYAYDGAGHGTLTLHDLSAGSLGSLSGTLPKLTLKLEGENTLSVQNAGDVVISGDGSLTAPENGLSVSCGELTVLDGTVTAAGSIAVDRGDLTIAGGTVESAALSAGDSLTVTGGAAKTGLVRAQSVTVTGGTLDVAVRGDVRYAVEAHEVTVSGGALNASVSGNTMSESDVVNAHRLTVSDGTVTVLAENCRYNRGLFLDELIVTGGTLDVAVRGDKADAPTFAIFILNNAFISGGTVNSTITGVRGHSAFPMELRFADSRLVISGGTVNLTASQNSSNYAISSSGPMLITGGTVNLTAQNGGVNAAFWGSEYQNLPTFSGGTITIRAEELQQYPVLKNGMTLISETENGDGSFTFVYEKVDTGDGGDDGGDAGDENKDPAPDDIPPTDDNTQAGAGTQTGNNAQTDNNAPEPDDNTQASTQTPAGTSPHTGDSSTPWVEFAVLLGSAAGICGMAVSNRKRKATDQNR